MEAVQTWGMSSPKHKKNKGDEELTFWQRLEKASTFAGKPCLPSDIVKELGVVPSAVTKYRDGHFPTKDKINKLAVARGVRAEWLLSGIGEMIAEEALDEETLELLRIWRNLMPDAKDRMLVNLRYELTAAQSLDTGKRLALTEELIKLLRAQPTKPQ